MKSNENLGNGMHDKFLTINPKKEKPVNCIYCDNNRNCTNKAHKGYYLSYCNDSSHCPLKKTKEQAEQDTQIAKEKSKKRPFSGIKRIPISDIIGPKTNATTYGKDIKKKTRYFLEHGRFEKPLFIKINEDYQFEFYRGLLTYLTAKEMKIKEIDCLLVDDETYEKYKKLTTVGTLINHKNLFGNFLSSGEVVSVDYDEITVWLYSGAGKTIKTLKASLLLKDDFYTVINNAEIITTS